MSKAIRLCTSLLLAVLANGAHGAPPQADVDAWIAKIEAPQIPGKMNSTP